MSLGAYLAVSAALFAIGLAMMIARRNLLYILMGIELVLNAANLNFVAFARHSAATGGEALRGQVFALIVILLAVAEAAVALAIVLHVYTLFDSVRPEETDALRE